MPTSQTMMNDETDDDKFVVLYLTDEVDVVESWSSDGVEPDDAH